MIPFNLFIRNALILASLLPVSLLYAQPAKLIRVKNGQDATKTVAAKDRFQYTHFQTGKLTYNNGKFATGKLNYCYLLGEIVFINTNGDTLAIADNNLVSYADIGNVRYYPVPENGYAEVVDDCGTMLLTKKVQYQKDGIEKKGAYQNANELGSSYNATTFTDINGRTSILTANNIILLKQVVIYLFMDINHRFSKATKANLLKIFSKKKEVIEPYLETQNFNYSNEEDLKKAVRYCSAL